MLAPGEPIDIKNAKGKTTGQIAFTQFKMDMRPSLEKYLEPKTGWKMNVTIAIDFTLSNFDK